MEEFEKEILSKLITHLNLEDVDTHDVTSETTLFKDGLELDSIDAIEIEVMIKREYGIDVSKSERNQATFGSIGSLAAFIESNLNRDA